jgi:hypothetical protein
VDCSLDQGDVEQTDRARAVGWHRAGHPLHAPQSDAIPVRHDIRMSDRGRRKTRHSKHETDADRLEHHVPQQLFVNEVEQLYGCDQRQIMRIEWEIHENWLRRNNCALG